jgi:hypothetical protein
MNERTSFDPQNGKRYFCSQHHVGQIWGAQLDSHSTVIGGSFPKVKRSERNADAVPPFSAEFKNHWSCNVSL